MPRPGSPTSCSSKQVTQGLVSAGGTGLEFVHHCSPPGDGAHSQGHPGLGPCPPTPQLTSRALPCCWWPQHAHEQAPTFTSSTLKRRLGSQEEKGLITPSSHLSPLLMGDKPGLLPETFQFMPTFFSHLFTKKAFSEKPLDNHCPLRKGDLEMTSVSNLVRPLTPQQIFPYSSPSQEAEGRTSLGPSPMVEGVASQAMTPK